MGDNILSAIINIANFGIFDLKDYATKSHIRINAVGDQLEFFIKDAISGAFGKKNEEEKEKEHQKTFSYLGNQNNPPDIMIKKSDAFEIKKIENKSSTIALNSSPPKNILYSNDNRITSFCRSCESKPWDKKDLFYVVGNVQKKIINYLFFVQGTCYCADKEVYNRIHEPLKEEIDNLIKEKGLENGKTNELGRVKKTDPLGITDLRIRGMWHIQNPLKVFSQYCKLDSQNTFSLFAILKKDKYLSYDKKDRSKIESNKNISVQDIKIKNPDNPAKSIEAKLISLMIK
ncbi:NgoPII family restriction endonuclease [Candidatus Pacearchaeota archaeon]|nr:NgoPII family restriction endonuclease [Candidatus Pacearchaeota archaeon]